MGLFDAKMNFLINLPSLQKFKAINSYILYQYPIKTEVTVSVFFLYHNGKHNLYFHIHKQKVLPNNFNVRFWQQSVSSNSNGNELCSSHYWFVWGFFQFHESQIVGKLPKDSSKHSMISLYNNNCSYFRRHLNCK